MVRPSVSRSVGSLVGPSVMLCKNQRKRLKKRSNDVNFATVKNDENDDDDDDDRGNDDDELGGY